MKQINFASYGAPAFDYIDGSEEIVQPDNRDVFLLKTHVVIICIEGKFSFTSSSGRHCCQKGSVCLLVKDSICRLTSVSADCRLAVMVSETNSLHYTATSMTNLMLFFRHYLEHPVSKLTQDEFKVAVSIYHCMKDVYQSRDFVSQTQMRQALDLVMFHLLMAHVSVIGRPRKKSSRRQRQIFEQFIADLGKNYRQQRKLDYYASLQCITPKHLTFAVKAESGLSARQWICDHVMIEARELLSQKQMSVQEVSDRLHFPDQSVFGKFFKTHEGLSPLQYQKNI